MLTGAKILSYRSVKLILQKNEAQSYFFYGSFVLILLSDDERRFTLHYSALSSVIQILSENTCKQVSYPFNN